MWCAATDPAHPHHALALADAADIVGSDVDLADYAPTPFDIDEINGALAGPAPGDTELPGALADLVPALPRRDAAWLEKAIAAIPLPDAPDAEAAARAVQPFTWLLDRVGADGITLTGAGYLPPAHVQAVAEELGITKTGIGKFNREVQTFPVLAFREAAQQAKLLRKHRGKLVLTPAGRKLRTDPVGLWQHLAAQLPVGPGECERQAGLLLLIGVAAGWDDLDAGIARGLDAAGWVDDQGSLTSSSAYTASLATRTVLQRLGAIERQGWPAPDRATEIGVAFARAAVWTWP
jgi:hypothetical protein